MWREYRTELPKGGLHGPFAVGSYSDGMAQIGLGFPSPRHRGSGLAAGSRGGIAVIRPADVGCAGVLMSNAAVQGPARQTRLDPTVGSAGITNGFPNPARRRKQIVSR